MWYYTESHTTRCVAEPVVGLFLCRKERNVFQMLIFHCAVSHMAQNMISLLILCLPGEYLFSVTDTHFNSVGFYEFFCQNLILENQLGGFFWNDISSGLSSLLLLQVIRVMSKLRRTKIKLMLCTVQINFNLIKSESQSCFVTLATLNHRRFLVSQKQDVKLFLTNQLFKRTTWTTMKHHKNNSSH